MLIEFRTGSNHKPANLINLLFWLEQSLILALPKANEDHLSISACNQ
jgi:membrane-anchored glycerophosphoryl diester phosphodiesterase (GDPDase)